MRNAFADELTTLAAGDERIVLLSGDIGNRLFDNFKERAPERFLNCGVAEANMISVAAGMGLCGLRPVVYTIAPFATIRCLEQIRVDACYHESPVTIVGTGAGLAYAQLGPTHHSLEDLAILRALPGMTILAPCDEYELRPLLRQAVRHPGPVYLRIGKKGEPRIHPGEVAARIGSAITVKDGRVACLISTGNIMGEVVGAAALLEEGGVSTRIESFHTVKPLDHARLEEVFSQYAVVAVVEEHSCLGGLGGGVAEWLAQHPGQSRMLAFGTADAFLHETGSQAFARQRFGLTAQVIATRVKQALVSA